MDLLYTRKFDGFCLVTSDSDFTGLAVRIREEGLTVLGFVTRDFKDTIQARALQDPAFRKALLQEGVECLLSGDVDIGKAVVDSTAKCNG